MGRFGEVMVETAGAQYIFETRVYLDDLDPEAVRSELYANGINGDMPERVEMKRVLPLVGRNQWLRLSGRGICSPSGGELYGAPYSTPQ